MGEQVSTTKQVVSTWARRVAVGALLLGLGCAGYAASRTFTVGHTNVDEAVQEFDMPTMPSQANIKCKAGCVNTAATCVAQCAQKSVDCGKTCVDATATPPTV